jgi:AAA15 family ATPase/GTPase
MACCAARLTAPLQERTLRPLMTRLEIQNFRGLRALTLDGLRRINLVVGRNNSGKTSFLEATYLATMP